jgi:hypothetical protein
MHNEIFLKKNIYLFIIFENLCRTCTTSKFCNTVLGCLKNLKKNKLENVLNRIC